MAANSFFLAQVAAVVLLASCTPVPPPMAADPTPPSKEVFQQAARRLTAVVVSGDGDVSDWVASGFRAGKPPEDADGGSAVPITSDGYFLTADHVLSSSGGRQVFLIHRAGGRLLASKARIVWRGVESDLALLHAEVETPEFYQWTPSDQWLPTGTPVMHAGISTGFRSPAGKLITAVPPESRMSGSRQFKHDIPLEPGDSGGPVVDARGLLVGVNSAVEFLVPLETAFFIESEANRPNVARLERLIVRDRKSRGR